MKIKCWGIYIANLNPPIGTKPKKVRPVLSIQPDIINEYGHTSTVVLPLSSQVKNKNMFPLRVYLEGGSFGLKQDSVILVDQVLACDNRFFLEEIGFLSHTKIREVKLAFASFFEWPS